MKAWEKLRLLFSPRCEEISELSSRRLDGSLPPTEELSRRLHFVTCASCRRYNEQLKFMQDAFRKLPPPPDEHLSPAARERIAKSISGEVKFSAGPSSE